MQSRRVKLEDGRYFIFYTFDGADGDLSTPAAEKQEQPRGTPAREEPVAPRPQAEEERRV